MLSTACLYILAIELCIFEELVAILNSTSMFIKLFVGLIILGLTTNVFSNLGLKSKLIDNSKVFNKTDTTPSKISNSKINLSGH